MATPSVGGETILIPSEDTQRELPFVDKSNYGPVHTVNRTTGNPRWVTQISSDVISTTAAADGLVYVPAKDSLVGVDTITGNRKFSFGMTSFGPPIVAYRVYISARMLQL